MSNEEEKTENHVTRVIVHEGHISLYGHCSKSCDPAGCAGDELFFGECLPSDLETSDGENYWAEINGEICNLDPGKFSRIQNALGNSSSEEHTPN